MKTKQNTSKNNKVIRRVRNDKVKQNTSSWNIDFVYFQEKYKTGNNYLVNWFYTRRKRIPQRLYSFSLIIQLKIHYVENCNHSKWLPWKINLFNYEIRFCYLLGYKLVFNFDDFCFRAVNSFRIFFLFSLGYHYLPLFENGTAIFFIIGVLWYLSPVENKC